MVVHEFLFTNTHTAGLPGETDPGGQDKKEGYQVIFCFSVRIQGQNKSESFTCLQLNHMPDF